MSENMRREEYKSLFKSRWEAVSGEFASPFEGVDLFYGLANYLVGEKISSVVSGGAPLDPAYARAIKQKVNLLMDFWEPVESHIAAIEICSQAQAGIHGVEALIADTGTLVVASRRPGDRLVSALPPISIAVVKDVPIYLNLSEFLNVIDKNLSYTFITGPSRTADIEKRLVLGVHGPLRTIIWGGE